MFDCDEAERVVSLLFKREFYVAPPLSTEIPGFSSIRSAYYHPPRYQRKEGGRSRVDRRGAAKGHRALDGTSEHDLVDAESWCFQTRVT